MATVSPAGAQTRSPKAEQVLDAAAALFLEQGFGAVSMDAVAQAAGVSKATVYAHFAGKDALFAAIIERACLRHAEVLSGRDAASSDVAGVLHAVGSGFLGLLLTPQTLGIFRLVVAESPRFPSLGRIFFESGPRRVLERLEAVIRSAAARGALETDDPHRAAEHFVGLLKGELHLKVVLGIAEDVGQAEFDATVDAAVSAFLRAYAPKPRHTTTGYAPLADAGAGAV